MTCHTYEISVENLAGFTMATKRRWSKRKSALEGSQNLAAGRREKSRIHGEMSMHSFDLILVQLSFAKIDPSEDICAMFCCEPIQKLSLEVSQ